MTDIVEMLEADHAMATSRAQRNRAEADAHGMAWVGNAVDLLRAGGFPQARPTCLDNGNGWTRGKREFDPDAPCSLVDAARGGRPEWRKWA